MNVAAIALMLVAVPLQGGPWILDAKTDAFSDKTTIGAMALGKEKRFGIALTCAPDGDQRISIFAIGQWIGGSSMRAASVDIRADSREAITVRGAGLRETVSWTKANHADFPVLLGELALAQSRILVRANSISGRVVEDEFSAENARAAIGQVEAACR